MAVTVYRSTDASAPVLTGQVGSLIALLDAVLVNGYGAKSAAGWTKPYTGTNLAAFRNSTTDGTGSYLRVDNSSASYGGVYVHGFTAMTDISTGTGGFPVGNTATNNYEVWPVSLTVNSTARPWVIIADAFRFHLFIQSGYYKTVATEWEHAYFGDILSYKPADTMRALLVGSYVATNNLAAICPSTRTSATYHGSHLRLCHLPYQDTAGATGQFMSNTGHGDGSNPGREVAMPGNVLGALSPIGMTVTAGLHHSPAFGASAFVCGNSAGLVYPLVANSGLVMVPLYLYDGQVATGRCASLRGTWPGVLAPLHNNALTNNDTFSGSGDFAGRTFEVFSCLTSTYDISSYSLVAQIIIETSDTWGNTP
jgi:hypothetical protein